MKNRIDIVSGIAFVTGLILFAVASVHLFTLFLVPVAIFCSYYAGRLTGKEVAHEEAELEKLNSDEFRKPFDELMRLVDAIDARPLHISDFCIGFEYEEFEMDKERYLNKGMIWVKKTYNFGSPRLHKIQELLDQGKLRRVRIETVEA